jgi:hypothetical protein
MFKQYHPIRALRYAAIAVDLAAGLEGFKQVFFPNLVPGPENTP